MSQSKYEIFWRSARGEGQRYKKIIDLDLKDQDHLIDLDLLHDLDYYW